MPRKMISIEPSRLAALELLATDRGDSLSELIDEAIDGLLKKHRRPVTTSDMFVASASRAAARPSAPASKRRRQGA